MADMNKKMQRKMEKMAKKSSVDNDQFLNDNFDNNINNIPDNSNSNYNNEIIPKNNIYEERGIDANASFGKTKIVSNDAPVDMFNKKKSAQPSKNITPVPGKKNGKKKTPSKIMVPKTAQQTIPYYSVYKNGIIENKPGTFSKSYKLHDVNFRIATQEEQEGIFMNYGALLNMFSPNVSFEITVFNRNINMDEFRKQAFLKMKNDNLDKYRVEMNDILEDKMSNGRNNIVHDKFLTVSLEANDFEDAVRQFSRIDTDVNTYVKKMNGAETHPMTLEERLSILYEIYNLDSKRSFESVSKINNHPTKSFDIEWIAKQGISTKDIIAPPAISFKKDYVEIGNMFARTLYLKNIATYLSTDWIPDITDIACNMLTSFHFEPLDAVTSNRLIRNQGVNIRANLIEAQKKATKSGYDVRLVSPELQKAQEDVENMFDDVRARNQKLFLLTMVVTVFGETLEELDTHTQSVLSVAQSYTCDVEKLLYQQEQGFSTALPLARNELAIQRLLTTEAASVFMPFSSQELAQNNGMYYGLNAISNNLIRFNRINSKNANGVILGTPGSGKSFSAKREMINVLLGTDDDIYVIDPEREYAPLAALFNGEVVKIAAGSKTYINPFDMDLQYADDDDPITLKSDFIGSICETVIGGKFGLSPVQKSVIDRCVRQVYLPYIEHLSRLKNGATSDKSATPTLNDFYDLLLAQPEPEAQNLALALEIYCKGSLDTFSHKTNVNTSSRFIIYDIKDIGSGMKEMGLQVCLNDIWNKIIENKQRGKRTWFYIDEFYLLTQNESSARFLQQVYKRARKWNGIPTGITQNVEDLLASKEARGIINNCDFVYMLNQAPLDRVELGQMLNISESQMDYITNADAGQGLMYTGKFIIPFIDKFPSDNSLYKAMTTKPDEVDLSNFEAKTNK